MFEKITDPSRVIRREGHVPIRHRYTPGVAGTPFFTALRDRGEIIASTCPSCGITYCPPRLFCERDFSEMSPGDAVGPGGTLESFSIGYVGVEEEPLDRPVSVGLVRLDGADTVLVHYLLEDERPLEIGARVEAVVKPKRQRTGSMLDIQGFRLA